MHIDEDACYAAVRSRDRRFDGWFFVGVTSTGIFCRPSCPATTPRRANVRFFPTAAAAQAGGFRACRRCRPDTAPGSPEWNVRSDLAARAMVLIDDGLVDREGVGGVARRLAVSERHLHRILTAELGASPLALARARRAHTARILIETTDLPFTHLAFAAGFSSVRQFNDTVRAFYGASPGTLRADRTSALRRGRAGDPSAAPSGASTAIALRLATRAPFAGEELIAFLAARALPGIEAVDGTAYRRTLRLPGGPGTVALRAAEDHVTASLQLTDLRDLGPAVARCRHLLDLDADPVAVDAALGTDPLLGPIVLATPGRRAPAAADPAEMLVRAIVGQQVSVAGARTVTGRLVAALGEVLPEALLRRPTDDAGTGPALTHAFPSAGAIARAAVEQPHLFAMPAARRQTLARACGLLASGDLQLDPGADRAEAEERLLALPGIGPWTAGYLAMRALGDPDVFLPTDIGVRNGLTALGAASDPRSAAARAQAWRPWRSYALQHLWATA